MKDEFEQARAEASAGKNPVLKLGVVPAKPLKSFPQLKQHSFKKGSNRALFNHFGDFFERFSRSFGTLSIKRDPRDLPMGSETLLKFKPIIQGK